MTCLGGGEGGRKGEKGKRRAEKGVGEGHEIRKGEKRKKTREGFDKPQRKRKRVMVLLAKRE